MLPANAHVIRQATPSDGLALRRIAYLDRQTPLTGHIYVAEVRGAVAAAISRAEGRAIADRSLAPAYLTTVLRLRMAGLDAAERQPDLSERLREALRGGRAAAGSSPAAQTASQAPGLAA